MGRTLSGDDPSTSQHAHWSEGSVRAARRGPGPHVHLRADGVEFRACWQPARVPLLRHRAAASAGVRLSRHARDEPHGHRRPHPRPGDARGHDDRRVHEALCGGLLRRHGRPSGAARRGVPAGDRAHSRDGRDDRTLVANGNAYVADGDVYYRIASFPAYGALSHLDRAGLKAGARVASDKYDKEHVSDFALWKKAQPGDEKIGAAWDAPFGRGRPGWHIECSAMSKRYLGDSLDIHAGGVDLMFPHHENEIAQSEAANHKTYARVWLHSEHLADATGEKMSKSAGGFTTLRDLIDAGHDPLAIRFFL